MGWIIAGSIVLFFVLLLAGRAAVFFDYNGTLALKIKYMCFTIVKLPKKKEPKKKDKKKSENDKKSDSKKAEDGEGDKKDDKKSDKKGKKGKKDEKGEQEEPKKKSGFSLKDLSFDDWIDLLKMAFSGVIKPLKKLFKRIVFSHMSINIVCGGDDAAKTAIKYGAMNAAGGHLLGFLDTFFTLEPLDNYHIEADFQSEETFVDFYFEVRLSLFAGVAAAFGLLGAVLKLYRAYKKKLKKAKAARKEKIAEKVN